MRDITLLGLSYSVAGLVAYGLTIAAAVRLRKKIPSHAFLTLYLTAAIVDLATHINTWVMYRLRFEPAFFFYFEWIIQPDMEIWRNIQFFLVNLYYFEQNACVFLLMLNRYTVVFHNERHEWFWNNYKWLAMLVTHLVSFITCLGARLFSNSNVTFVFNSSVPSYEVRGDADSKPILIAMICYGAVMLVTCSFMNIRLFCRLLAFNNEKLDRGLVVVTLLTFLAQAANIFTVIISSIFIFREDWDGLKPFTSLVPIFSDLFSLGPAVFSLLAPGPISHFYFNKISKWIKRKWSVSPLIRNYTETQPNVAA